MLLTRQARRRCVGGEREGAQTQQQPQVHTERGTRIGEPNPQETETIGYKTTE